MLPSTTHLVFGSQILDLFNSESARDFRNALLSSPQLDWIVETIRSLPQTWSIISDSIPLLNSASLVQLDELARWMRTGDASQLTQNAPNIVLTPLVVATHLCQYVQFLELLSNGDHSKRPHLWIRDCQTAGFCTGQLSAAAVNSSSFFEFCKHGTAAINTAMAIGAFVDAAGSDGWKSFVVRRGSETNDGVATALAQFSEAYVSVVLDAEKVTLSIPESNAELLADRLKGQRMSEIALQGPFHHPGNAHHLEPLLRILKDDPVFQLPQVDGISAGCQIARSMLTQPSNWPEELASFSLGEDSLVIAFGSSASMPPSLAPMLGSRMWQISGFQPAIDFAPAPFQRLILATRRAADFNANEKIAVVGMACKTAVGEDLERFWQLLCHGESQHVELSPERHDHQNEWVSGEFDRKVFASFISDADSFDHRFFKKSPREASSTDPQHRLALETAYQALEQAGYFSKSVTERDCHVGCYIGIGLAEYERNVASHPATAYAVTGNLMSFAAGKISHHFGWRGPSIAVNAACSSSGVAVDLACKALLSGECSAALAGGVNAITRPEWFNFLGAGSFLSSTGQCKPFDQKADGYSRGEGVGAVYLKRLSTAIRDGDNILGVIAASRCFQNQHSSTITAPTSTSLSELFGTVVAEAGLQPKQVSFVEAHGTGTQVGDTIEYDSIRRVLGGASRDDILHLGAVKGLVGHTESASGIVALVKALLCLHNKSIPRAHPSFSSLNPNLNPSPSDKIEINTTTVPWSVPFRAAMVNNYGASGANVAHIITEPPAMKPSSTTTLPGTLRKYPFWVSGLDEDSIVRYAGRLLRFLRSNAGQFTLESLSFQLSRQSNRSLSHASIFSCSTVLELEDKLESLAQGRPDRPAVKAVVSSRPVILCFGGQVSRTVGLDRGIYESCTVLRNHLDECDAVFRKLGLPSMYPDIFDEVTPADIIALQARLFALQYSCAKAWIDSGVQVAATIGHSFGELVATCVSGIIALMDMARIVVARAKIIQEYWSSERGAMLAVDADSQIVEFLIREVCRTGDTIEIACFNGPRSFTLAGSSTAIRIAQDLATSKAAYASMKVKALDVTHAYHSALVEPLIPTLRAIDSNAIWRDPIIPLERATRDENHTLPPAGFFAEHMRKPVHFYQAAQRLHDKYPASVWLEAGSNSGVTSLARSFASNLTNHFQAVNVSSNQSSKCLADVTSSLWEQGQNVHFWAHHPSEVINYPFMPLPPYQFEKSKHWLKPQSQVLGKDTPQAIVQEPETLWTFVGYQDADKRHARFRVNTRSQQYQNLVSAHVVAQTAKVCPSTLQMALAIDTIQSVISSDGASELIPQIRRMENHLALCIDTKQDIWLDAEQLGDNGLSWTWKIFGSDNPTSNPTLYVSGLVKFASVDDADYQITWDTYDRLADSSRCKALLDSGDADGVLKGRHNIYKAFAPFVDYRDEHYRGLSVLAGRAEESAGRVTIKDKVKSYVDAVSIIEPVCQTAGIYLSSMTERDVDDMYISHGISQFTAAKLSGFSTTFEVLARHRRSEKGCISDVFAFDLDTGKLSMAILGIGYNRIAMPVLRKVLSSVSTDGGPRRPPTQPQNDATVAKNNMHSQPKDATSPVSPNTDLNGTGNQSTAANDLESPLRTLLGSLLGLDPERIEKNSDLIDIGVDSLLAMELARDVEKTFKIDLRLEDLFELTDFQSLLQHIQKRLGISTSSKRDSVLSVHDVDIMNAAAQTSDTEPIKSCIEASDDSIEAIGNPQANEKTASVNGYLETIEPVPTANGHYDQDGKYQESSPFRERIALLESEPTTDSLIADNGLANYLIEVEPELQELCVAYIVEAFEKLGSSVIHARPNDRLHRLTCDPSRAQFLDLLYVMLEAGGITRSDGSYIVRTESPLSTLSTEGMYRAFLGKHPESTLDCEIVQLVGSQLAPFLAGEIEGVQLTFGSPAGRKALTEWYANAPVNVAYITKMQNFLVKVVSDSGSQSRPIKILEIGGGTAGTTKRLIRALAESKADFEYTFSDISAGLVAAAKSTFRESRTMKFRVLDIEHPPMDLDHEFDIVLTTNCIHATRDLATSTRNIRNLLRPDGLLVMLEMTMNLPWINFVFGVFDGWWLFEDGRHHALTSQSAWQEVFEATGLTVLDQSSGELPDTAIQTVFIAQKCVRKVDSGIASPAPYDEPVMSGTTNIRHVAASYTRGFLPPTRTSKLETTPSENWVLLTGATGSLGAHLVQSFASLQCINGVVCLNRKGKMKAEERQASALKEKGIFLSPEAAAKIRVCEADTSQPMFGLSMDEYTELLQFTTFIVHNAWPMGVKRGLGGFEEQFKTMRNLLDFARDCCTQRSGRLGFQLVSSIAAQTYESNGTRNADTHMPGKEAVPEWGYGSAKLVCETMLEETLMRLPDSFQATIVRVGQISGSSSGSYYWNRKENLPLIIKSSQTVGALPRFEGELSWIPVDDVATILGELLLDNSSDHQLYHVENPYRLSWSEMSLSLAKALEISPDNIIPLEDWIARLKRFSSGEHLADNPAIQLVEHLSARFIPADCGRSIHDTMHSEAHSPTLKNLKPVSTELVMKYVEYWRSIGFLK